MCRGSTGNKVVLTLSRSVDTDDVVGEVLTRRDFKKGEH